MLFPKILFNHQFNPFKSIREKKTEKFRIKKYERDRDAHNFEKVANARLLRVL